MPLVRGTAACGYVTLLSVMWASDMPTTKHIPKNYQVSGCTAHVGYAMASNLFDRRVV